MNRRIEVLQTSALTTWLRRHRRNTIGGLGSRAFNKAAAAEALDRMALRRLGLKSRPQGGNSSVVECDLAKVEVAGSNPVSRSNPLGTKAAAGTSQPAVEGAAVVADARPPPGPVDRDHVEAQRALGQAVRARRRAAPRARCAAACRTSRPRSPRRATRPRRSFTSTNTVTSPSRATTSTSPDAAAEVAGQDREALRCEVPAGEVSRPRCPRRGPRRARAAAQRFRRHRVPFGVSSSTTPSASSRAARRVGARRTPAPARASCRSSKSACSSGAEPRPRAGGSSTPKTRVHRLELRRARERRPRASRARRRGARCASLTRPWTAASASGVLRSSPSAASNAGARLGARPPRPRRRRALAARPRRAAARGRGSRSSAAAACCRPSQVKLSGLR